MSDQVYLKRAVDLAKKSNEPVKCGCVIVRDKSIIAEAYNSQRQDEVAIHHAEVKAVFAANRAVRSRTLDGTVAYCSCEPCVMCLVALSLAKVERIVYARTMKELCPDDPMSNIDSKVFVRQFNFVPKLEQVMLS